MKEQIQRGADRRDLEGVGGGDAATRTKELVRWHGVSTNTFYTWRRRYGGMEVRETKRLKQLEDENRRLKGIVADMTLEMGDEGRDLKQTVSPTSRRKAVRHAREKHGLGERLALGALGQDPHVLDDVMM